MGVSLEAGETEVMEDVGGSGGGGVSAGEVGLARECTEMRSDGGVRVVGEGEKLAAVGGGGGAGCLGCFTEDSLGVPGAVVEIID